MRESLFKPKILERKRIDKLLDAILETPLFYLSASMGYGKTTAVRCYLDQRPKLRTIWINLSNAEGDEKWLWHESNSAVQQYNSKFAEKLMNLGFPNNEFEIRRILDLLKEEAKSPMVIVLDDYQEVKSDLMAKMLQMYTEYEIPNVHMVVISRMRPATEFLMLNIKHRCMMMWQGELAFTKEESRELFRINGFEINDQEIEEIYNYTMGWVAPTYLILLEYAAHQSISFINESAGLIKTAVYDLLDEETQRIIRLLGPIEKFTVELGEYITGSKRVQSVINTLIENNCFINLIPQTKQYQFHTLFRHTLMDELRKAEIDERKIYEQCAKWYQMKQKPLAAIDYYYKAHNYEAILEMMSVLGATEYIDIAPKLISNIFDHISMEEKLSHPIGYLTYIHSYITNAQNEESYRMFYEAKAYYEGHREIENWNHIMGELDLIESFTKLPNAVEMIEYISKAYEKLNEGRSLISGPNMIWTCGNINAISLFYGQAGTFKQVRDFVLGHFDYFKHVSNGCGTGAKYLVQAEYAYEVGNLEEARVLAYKAIYKAETKKQYSNIVNAYFTLMRISYIKGNMEEINQYIEEVTRKASEGNHPMLYSAAEVMRTYIYALSHQIDKVPAWVEAFDMKDSMGALHRIVLEPIAIGSVLIHKQEYLQLDVLMEIYVEEYKKASYLYGMIHAFILWAIAKKNLYDEDEGAEALNEAIQIAKQDHIIMPFVEHREEIRELLENLQGAEHFATEILNYRIDSAVQELEEDLSQTEVQLLTEREKEVMRLFVKGYKQSEVAKELQITTDTVKRHIKNVYAKLEIHSKAELIERLGNVL